jgi:hypothetical protein
VGVGLLVLAFGRFHPYAPWPLLHLLPVFSSQHVPSRWMLPALLVLACAAASTGERLLVRAGRTRALLEIVAVVAVGWMANDISHISRTSLTRTFGRPAPVIPDPLRAFKMLQHVPPELDYDPGEWAPSTLTAVMANVGSLDCNTFPGFNNYTRGQNGRSPGLGARVVGDPLYRGEAYVAEGHATATVVRFSPNAVDVQVDGARPGDHVVLNQNWDPGWRVDGTPSVAREDTVSGTLTAGTELVHFRYFPKTEWLGILIFLVAAMAPFLGPLRRRWKRSRSAPIAGTAPSPSPP